jgi:hypothetical protein
MTFYCGFPPFIEAEEDASNVSDLTVSKLSSRNQWINAAICFISTYWQANCSSKDSLTILPGNE